MSSQPLKKTTRKIFVFESLVKQNYRHVELSIDPPLFLTKKIPPPPPPFNAAGPTLYTTKISSRISKQTNFVCVCVFYAYYIITTLTMMVLLFLVD